MGIRGLGVLFFVRNGAPISSVEQDYFVGKRPRKTGGKTKKWKKGS